MRTSSSSSSLVPPQIGSAAPENVHQPTRASSPAPALAAAELVETSSPTAARSSGEQARATQLRAQTPRSEASALPEYQQFPQLHLPVLNHEAADPRLARLLRQIESPGQWQRLSGQGGIGGAGVAIRELKDFLATLPVNDDAHARGQREYALRWLARTLGALPAESQATGVRLLSRYLAPELTLRTASTSMHVPAAVQQAATRPNGQSHIASPETRLEILQALLLTQQLPTLRVADAAEIGLAQLSDAQRMPDLVNRCRLLSCLVQGVEMGLRREGRPALRRMLETQVRDIRRLVEQELFPNYTPNPPASHEPLWVVQNELINSSREARHIFNRQVFDRALRGAEPPSYSAPPETQGHNENQQEAQETSPVKS